MESQEAPKVVDVENLQPIIKREEPTETPICGCRGQMSAKFLRSIMDK